MATWFGMRMQEAGDVTRKQWSVFVSEDGALIRQWGPAVTVVGGGSFNQEDLTLPAAKRKAAIYIEGKLRGASRYRITGLPSVFSAPDGADRNTLVRCYHAAAVRTVVGEPWEMKLGSLGVTPPPSAPTAAKPEVVSPGPVTLDDAEEKSYTRPNGDRYYPRRISGLHDVALLRTAARRNETVLLYGPPGCGKTALAEAAFPDSITINGNSSMEAGDLIGRWLPAETGGYTWHDGPAVEAAERGTALFIDEIARIDTQVLSVLFPLMDGRGWISVDERPAAAGTRKIKAAEGFCVIAAFNPYDGPAAQIGEALWSRFTHKIEYTTDHALCRSLKVPARAIKAAVKLDAMLRNDETSWAPQTRELFRFRDLAARYGEAYAADSLVAEAPFDARQTVAAVVRDAFASPDIEPLVTKGRA